MSCCYFAFLATALTLAGIAAPPPARAAEPVQKIILDTDIGDDIDDAYALTLLATRPGVKLLGVTTAFGQTHERAQLAAKLLHVIGRDDVPVCAGRTGEAKIGTQYGWARGFTSKSIRQEDAVTFLKRQIDRNPGEITLIAIGALSNVGDLFARYPETASKIKGLFIMGGAVHVGYNNKPPAEPEWNIRCDPPAAKVVFTSGVPLTMAGLESTTMMKFDAPLQKRLFARGTAATDALAALTLLWGGGTPTLFDTVAVARALDQHFADEETLNVVVEPNGLTRPGEGKPNVKLLVRPQKEAFLEWFVSTLTAP